MFWLDRIYRRSVFVAVLALSGMARPACAQNNPQRISDRFYPMYVRAYNMRKSPASLAVADSLRKASIAAGDRRGEVFALSIPFLYEFYRPNNIARLEKAMKPFQQKAMDYGFTNLYYYAISMKVAYFTREHMYIEALLYLKAQSELAEKRGHGEKVWAQYRMLGVIQHFRGELSQAIGSYQDAIDSYKRNGTPRYISREYLSIADCYRMMCDYERLLKAADEAMPYCVTQGDRNNVYVYKCYGNFMLGRDQEFLDGCKYLDSHKQSIDNGYVFMNTALKACRAMFDGDDAEALKLIREVDKASPEEGSRLYIAYYSRKGDYKEAIEYMMRIAAARYEEGEETFRYDQRSVDRIFRDQKLEAERQRIISRNTQLSLLNAQMSLRNSSLELGRRRDAARLADAAAAQSMLSANNQRLVTRQLRDSIATQQLVQLSKNRRQRMERFVYLAILVMAVAAMIMTLIYSLFKRMLAKRLLVANGSLNETICSLNVAREKAQESERMKTLFIQNMSHEIRTPLNAIVGFSQLITDADSGLGNAEKKEMAGYIADNSEMLTTLVNDILDISTLQSGKFSLDMSRVEVNAACRETLETVRHRLQEGVELRFETDLPDGFLVNTDRHRVRQVLINMLTNAEKNTSAGSITLKCSRRANPGMLTFIVTDTGIGVPRELQERIFQRFQKLDACKQGTGLGLDICRNIARCLGGEIDIDHEYTGGARFWFTIPIDK